METVNIREVKKRLAMIETGWDSESFSYLESACKNAGINHNWVIILLFIEGANVRSRKPYGIGQWIRTSGQEVGLDVDIEYDLYDQIIFLIKTIQNDIKRFGKHKSVYEMLVGHFLPSMRTKDYFDRPDHVMGSEVSPKTARAVKESNDPNSVWSSSTGIKVVEYLNYIRSRLKFSFIEIRGKVETVSVDTVSASNETVDSNNAFQGWSKQGGKGPFDLKEMIKKIS